MGEIMGDFDKLNRIREQFDRSSETLTNVSEVTGESGFRRLHILWLYPDVLNIHGGRGDVMAFLHMCDLMDIPVEIRRLDDVKAGRYIARYSRQAFPLELNRSLDVGSEYHFKFMGTDEGFNVKRVTINGEEVQLTQDPSNSYTKVSPDRTLGSFDDVVVIEFEEENSGDINGDGSVTIADVTKLVNKILGKE